MEPNQSRVNPVNPGNVDLLKMVSRRRTRLWSPIFRMTSARKRYALQASDICVEALLTFYSSRNSSLLTILPLQRLPFAPSLVTWSKNYKPATSLVRDVASASFPLDQRSYNRKPSAKWMGRRLKVARSPSKLPLIAQAKRTLTPRLLGPRLLLRMEWSRPMTLPRPSLPPRQIGKSM